MNRCAAWGRALAATLLLAGLAAQAQVTRHFPATALRGELIATAPPDVRLNGQPARLAPGARVRNEENRFEVMGAIAGQRLIVHYTTDSGGQLLDIWILRPSELANQPWPVTREQAGSWSFDPVTQKWTRP